MNAAAVGLVAADVSIRASDILGFRSWRRIPLSTVRYRNWCARLMGIR